ncbi:MAG: helix-turn-helix domain-containing protein, partial [Conexivisphaera sp.]
GTPYSPGPGPQRRAERPAPRPREEELEELIVVPDYNRLVKEARERMGLTQEELAAKVGVKASVISKIESGRLRPDVATSRRLEGVLRIRILTRMDELET